MHIKCKQNITHGVKIGLLNILFVFNNNYTLEESNELIKYKVRQCVSSAGQVAYKLFSPERCYSSVPST